VITTVLSNAWWKWIPRKALAARSLDVVTPTSQDTFGIVCRVRDTKHKAPNLRHGGPSLAKGISGTGANRDRLYCLQSSTSQSILYFWIVQHPTIRPRSLSNACAQCSRHGPLIQPEPLHFGPVLITLKKAHNGTMARTTLRNRQSPRF